MIATMHLNCNKSQVKLDFENKIIFLIIKLLNMYDYNNIQYNQNHYKSLNKVNQNNYVCIHYIFSY